MASITVRNIDDDVKKRLRMRAAEHGRSMEDEVRNLIDQAVSQPKQQDKLGLGESIRRRFAPLGGVDLNLPKRRPMRKLPDFK